MRKWHVLTMAICGEQNLDARAARLERWCRTTEQRTDAAIKYRMPTAATASHPVASRTIAFVRPSDGGLPVLFQHLSLTLAIFGLPSGLHCL